MGAISGFNRDALYGFDAVPPQDVPNGSGFCLANCLEDDLSVSVHQADRGFEMTGIEANPVVLIDHPASPERLMSDAMTIHVSSGSRIGMILTRVISA